MTYAEHRIFMTTRVSICDSIPEPREMVLGEPRGRRDEQVRVEAVDVNANRVTSLGHAKHAHDRGRTMVGTRHVGPSLSCN